MPEFKRSRLERKSEEQVTKKTVILGIITILLFILIVIFGLPFLVRFSVFLGDIKNKRTEVITEKVLPPLPPRLVLPFDATNSGQIDISGLAEAGVEVELLKNDVSIGKTEVAATGDFNFKNVSLDKGENTFSAIARTEKGGGSDVSKLVKIVFDDQPPELKMLNPSESELSVDYADFDIVGQSEKGVSVLINGRVAMVDDEGKFKLKMQLGAGKNEIEIVVRDAAGNETKKKIIITYNI